MCQQSVCSNTRTAKGCSARTCSGLAHTPRTHTHASEPTCFAVFYFRRACKYARYANSDAHASTHANTLDERAYLHARLTRMSDAHASTHARRACKYACKFDACKYACRRACQTRMQVRTLHVTLCKYARSFPNQETYVQVN